MGPVSMLLTFPVAGPIKGLIFIAEKLAARALEEMLDEDEVQRQLMELELRRDLGEIDDAEYTAREEELLHWLDSIREYKEQEGKES